VVDEREILKDSLDAVLPRDLRTRERHGLSVHENLAGIGLKRAGEDLDQCRFSGPIVADEGMNLAGAQGEVAAAERDDPCEVLEQGPRLNHRTDFTRQQFVPPGQHATRYQAVGTNEAATVTRFVIFCQAM